MNFMYAMQRANGDWFALYDEGRLRVPVFFSSSAAQIARSRHFGMLLFKPVALDEDALHDLAPTEPGSGTGYWLVKDPSSNLNRGRPLEHAQLALLIRDSSEQTPV
jgi:hypothetical protein